MLKIVHNALVDRNFCNNNRKAIKLQIVADSKHHMGYVDKGDRMTDSNSISRCTWKWTQKLFFCLLNLAILTALFCFCFPHVGLKFCIQIFGEQ